jgi:hypothetical protein
MNASVFEVRTAGCIEITVLRDAMPPVMVNDYQCFGGIRPVLLNIEICRIS